MKRLSVSESDTRQVASDWLQQAGATGIVLLDGDLGAGKTCFVRGMLEAFGWEGAVTSPTYSLMQEYPTSPPLIHLDLYRLLDPEEIWDLGVEEWLEQPCWMAVEWSERAGSFWPELTWNVSITSDPQAPDHRWIEIVAPGENPL